MKDLVVRLGGWKVSMESRNVIKGSRKHEMPEEVAFWVTIFVPSGEIPQVCFRNRVQLRFTIPVSLFAVVEEEVSVGHNYSFVA